MSRTGTISGIRKPIYTDLADRLRKAIRSGQYAPGDLVGSEHALAKQEAISRMTVRRAIETLVDEGLLERRPGKGLYVAGRSAAAMRLVQVVAGNLQWEPSLQASRGVQSVAFARGIQTQLYDAHGEMQADLAMLRQLPASAAQGAVVVSLHNTAFNEAIYDLKRRGYPIVLIDQKLQDIDVPSVTADNHDGGYQAGKFLVSRGHRRLGFIGDLGATTVRDRLAGFRDAAADAAVLLDRSLVVDLDKDPDQNRLEDWSHTVDHCTRQVMRRPDRPTALFYSCDAFARAGCKALASLGLRVPDDVSVIGFDDDPLCQWMNPPLTSVRQPFFDMGVAALDMLCQTLENPDASVPSRVLPVQLVERQSVAAPSDRKPAG